MAEIGILHGTFESFPQAVLEELNSFRRGCCRYLSVDALNLVHREEAGWESFAVLVVEARGAGQRPVERSGGRGPRARQMWSA